MSKKKVRRKPVDDETSFEVALERLEGVVTQLESGELTLDEALAAYERGIACLKLCHGQLETAQRRIELLSGVDAQGNPITRPYDDSADESLEAKHAARGRRRTSGEKADADDSLLF